MITDAMIGKPKRKASRLGTFGEVLYSISPKSVDIILNAGVQPVPRLEGREGQEEEGAAPAGEGGRGARRGRTEEEMSTEAVAMAYLLKGVHF